MTRVRGYCPMGCGQTLAVMDDNRIGCGNPDCPDAGKVDGILDDPESEHVVTIALDRFSLRHPLREHDDDDLANCQAHTWLSAQSGPPVAPGRYRMSVDPTGDWYFERLESPPPRAR